MAQWHRDVLRRVARAGLIGFACAGICAPRSSEAQPPPPSPSVEQEAGIVILPTLTPTGELPSPTALRRPALADGLLWNKARELDGLLSDTAQDLGFVVDLSAPRTGSDLDASERALLARARHSVLWHLSPRLEFEGGDLVLRLLLVAPGADHAMVRTETVAAEDFQVRAVVMLRDLVNAGKKQPAVQGAPPGVVAAAEDLEDRRSEGRAVLAMHAAVFGGFVGYSLQKSSGSDDARLTYPLMALGTGVGLGGSLIIAEEWDVGLGDAWYMSAGATWPTFGGLMLAKGRNVQPESDRYAWGIGSGLAGISLASISLSFAGMATGGAAVAHSGGFIGTGFGAGTEMLVRGQTDTTPYEGLGYGALGGVLVGGIIGRWVEESPSRIMMIDVGAGLGALSLAAVGSPLLIGDATEGRQRAWVLLTMSGAAVGGATAYWMTSPRSRTDEAEAEVPLMGQPFAGVIGQSVRADGTVVPVLGGGWSGGF